MLALIDGKGGIERKIAVEEIVAEFAPRFGARRACRFVAAGIARRQHQQGARQRGPAEAGEFACHPILSLCSMAGFCHPARPAASRSEEHTSELQPLMRISYS